MTLPGFTAEVGTSGWSGFFPRHAAYTNRSSTHAISMAAQCCPPGSNTTGCAASPDCSNMHCPRGLVCCDCTEVHCTTPTQCGIECGK